MSLKKSVPTKTGKPILKPSTKKKNGSRLSKTKYHKNGSYSALPLSSFATEKLDILLDAGEKIFGDSEILPEKKDTNPKDSIGIKKAPLSCCSMPVFHEVGFVMLSGARKYGRHNYRSVGVRASVYFDAAMRHLSSWFEGEDLDPESGVSHLVHVMSCMMVLRDAQIRGKMTDDRPPGTSEFIRKLNEKAKEIIESTSDESVKHFFTDGTQDEYNP